MSFWRRDFPTTPFKGKISNAERGESFPRPHVVGYGSSSAGCDMEAGQVSVRLHHGGPQGAKPTGKSWRIFWRASKSGGRKAFI